MDKTSQVYLVPGSIIVAGILIAMGLFYSGGEGGTQVAGGFGNNLSIVAKNIRPVDANDHVFGNRDAKISIVEFSDFECPFCQRLHPTLLRVIDEYEGEVNWVYRHLPLSIHRNAMSSAVASECVARLGGNDAFWEFGDELFNNQRSLGEDLYFRAAGDLGIDRASLESCLGSHEIAEAVRQDAQDAANSGGRGTPYSVVIAENGDTHPFSGALSYEEVRSIIEGALNN